MRKILPIFLAVSLLALFTAAARPSLPKQSACAWTGMDEMSTNWFMPGNWSCTGGGIPKPDSDVIIAEGIQVPYLDGPVTIKTLTISSELDFGPGGELTASGGWHALQGAVLHGGGVLKGAGQVGPGNVLASITFEGSLNILPLSWLKAETAPHSTITSLADVTNYGVIGSVDNDGVFQMKGTVFQNYGEISVPEFYFNRGSGFYTYVSGDGAWTNAVDLRVGGDTRLKPTSRVTFGTRAFTVGLSGTGNVLDLSMAAVRFDGSGGAVRVSIIDSTLGDYELQTLGTVEIKSQYGSQVDVPLHVLSGETTGSGFFNRSLTVEEGAAVAVNAAPGGEMIVRGNVENRGLIRGLEPGSSFVLLGSRFDNHGTVNVGEFHFQRTEGEVVLAGSGAWGGEVNLHIDAGARLKLANSLAMQVKTFNVWGPDMGAGQPNLDIEGHTLTLNGPLTFTAANSSRIAGDGVFRTGGPVTLNTVGSAAFSPALSIQAGPGSGEAAKRTTLYGRFEGPVEVAAGAVLALNEDSQVLLHGDLTIHGSLDAAESSLLTISGAKVQLDGSFSSQGLTTFQAEEAQSIEGSGSMQTQELAVENPLGIDLSLPLSVGRSLTLDGDIRAVGDGLTLLEPAVTFGSAEVWGKVTRPGPFAWDRAYSFGSQRLTITFTPLSDEAAAPDSVTVILTAGAPDGLASAIRWYRILPSGGGLWEASLYLPYAWREVVPASSEPCLRLWRRGPAGGRWALVAGAVQHTGWHGFEVEGLTAFSDWAIASGRVFFPLLTR